VALDDISIEGYKGKFYLQGIGIKKQLRDNLILEGKNFQQNLPLIS